MGDADFGIKVTQPGWDVRQAGDPNFYFSSSWPWLKIAQTDVVRLSSTGTATVSHELKYPAFCLGYTDEDGVIIAGATPTTNTFTGGTANARMRYYIFLLPLNRPFEASQGHVSPTSQGGINHDFGFKVSKEGKDTDSSDLRDYTIHSGARSPLVHKVIYQHLAPIAYGDYANVYGLEWENELPYFPIYFAWSVKSDVFTPLNSVQPSTPKINYDGLDESFIRGIVINDLNRTSEYGCFVILKDPLDLTLSTVKVKL